MYARGTSKIKDFANFHCVVYLLYEGHQSRTRRGIMPRPMLSRLQRTSGHASFSRRGRVL